VSTVFSVSYIFADSAAFLLLSALGLIIILGMMGITNMAHGEFMMLGAYTTAIATHAGLPFGLSVLSSMLTMGAFGIIIEMLVIRRFYGNLLQSLVVTWGLSLVISQGMLIILGPSIPSLPMPMGGFSVGGKVYAAYRVFLPVISILVVAAMGLLLFKTRFGMKARATMQNPEIAQVMGVNTKAMYMFTFGLGSALTGLAGALYAPTTVLGPLYGANFLAPAFVTVVVSGGTNIIVGALMAAGILGLVDGIFNYWFGAVIGRLALLTATMFVIRFFPSGLSRWLANRRSV
jgi:branched-chain amino acid transport system permease protein